MNNTYEPPTVTADATNNLYTPIEIGTENPNEIKLTKCEIFWNVCIFLLLGWGLFVMFAGDILIIGISSFGALIATIGQLLLFGKKRNKIFIGCILGIIGHSICDICSIIAGATLTDRRKEEEEREGKRDDSGFGDLMAIFAYMGIAWYIVSIIFFIIILKKHKLCG